MAPALPCVKMNVAMALIRRFDGDEISVRYSRGPSRTPYFERWEDNVLALPAGEPWPSALLRQVRAYTALSLWFAPEDAEALARQLGVISKFQSAASEDAVTWSWFGTLGAAPSVARRHVVQWLYDRLGLALS